MNLIQSFGYSIWSAVIVFGLIYLMKLIVDKSVSSYYIADDQIKQGNMAISIRRIGLYTGTAIAMYSSINGWMMQLIDGITIVAFMLIALMISEKIILPSFNNIEALGKGNVAVGFTEAGLFIGTGIIASGSFSGEGPWISSIVFFALGQIVLLTAIRLNEIFHKGTLKEIENGNTSAGIMVGGLLIAYALILKSAIQGPFNGWVVDIESFFLSAAYGGLLLILFANKAIEKIFFKESSIGQEILKNNYSVAGVVAAIKIAIAITIGGVII